MTPDQLIARTKGYIEAQIADKERELIELQAEIGQLHDVLATIRQFERQ